MKQILRMRKHARALAALCLAALFSAGGCAARTETAEGACFAMDTYMRLTLYGAKAEAALAQCQAEIASLETKLSVTSAESEIARLNASGGAAAALSPDTAALLARAMALSKETGGAFQPCILPMCRAWGFSGAEAYAVPSEGERAALIKTVRETKLALSGDTAVLTGPAGAGVDLGGVAKGYLGARLAEICRARGIESALFDLGGNVQLVGAKPDGGAWNIGVQDPLDPNAVVGVIAAADTALVTTGAYQRYFERDGVRYHHILDPETGAPAESGLLSVTVVSSDGTAADALSTALFVMGAERAEAFWRARQDFDMLLVCADGEIRLTPGVAFTPAGERRVTEIR